MVGEVALVRPLAPGSVAARRPHFDTQQESPVKRLFALAVCALYGDEVSAHDLSDGGHRGLMLHRKAGSIKTANQPRRAMPGSNVGGLCVKHHRDEL